jgi:hypothetical protein
MIIPVTGKWQFQPGHFKGCRNASKNSEIFQFRRRAEKAEKPPWRIENEEVKTVLFRKKCRLQERQKPLIFIFYRII